MFTGYAQSPAVVFTVGLRLLLRLLCLLFLLSGFGLAGKFGAFSSRHDIVIALKLFSVHHGEECGGVVCIILLVFQNIKTRKILK